MAITYRVSLIGLHLDEDVVDADRVDEEGMISKMMSVAFAPMKPKMSTLAPAVNYAILLGFEKKLLPLILRKNGVYE